MPWPRSPPRSSPASRRGAGSQLARPNPLARPVGRHADAGDHDGTRRVNEIVAVPGRAENDIIETEPIFERVGGDLVRTGGMPPRAERYARVGVDLLGLLSEDA